VFFSLRGGDLDSRGRCTIAIDEKLSQQVVDAEKIISAWAAKRLQKFRPSLSKKISLADKRRLSLESMIPAGLARLGTNCLWN